MTYQELQKALKQFKEQGFTDIALNSKKIILQAEYDRLSSQAEEGNITAPIQEKEEMIINCEEKKSPIAEHQKREYKPIKITNLQENNKNDKSKTIVMTAVESCHSENSLTDSKGIITPEKKINDLKIDSRRAKNEQNQKITQELELLRKLVIIFCMALSKVFIRSKGTTQLIKALFTTAHQKLFIFFGEWLVGFTPPQFS